MDFTATSTAPASAGPTDWPALKEAIVSKLDIAAEYAALGVEFTRNGASKKGWRECRAFGRPASNPDDAPSGAVNIETGVYKDSGDGGVSMGLLDFALKHGNFGSWIETVKHYAARAGIEVGPVHASKGGRIREAIYEYRDAAGAVRYAVFRYRLPTGKKTFTQHPPDGRGGWKYGSGVMDGVEPLPYRLPELLASASLGEPIWVAEGEKDVDRLYAERLIATTNHQGAGASSLTWPRFRPEWFRGRPIFILPDNDPPGRSHARVVATWLHEAGVPCKVVELPGLPPRGDVSDWLDAGGTIEELGRLAHEAPDFDPAAEVAPEPADDTARDAHVGDLRRIVSSDGWLWKGWIPVGALTLLAAEGGTGKTRFCFDLHRRLFNGWPWPDGQPTPAIDQPRVLWVVADNQEQEMCDIPPAFGIPDEAVLVNAFASDPFSGTSLETEDDLAAFEERISRTKPALVVIDTITNTADYKSQDTSDAKRQYKPLQEIAKRQNVPIVCVTHLNAGGKALGRRAVEKCRVVVQLSMPDPEGQPNRRKLWVEKSKAIKPPALGVTMGDDGNEYDANPPEPPVARTNGATTGPLPVRAMECMAWLRTNLGNQPCRVKTVRDDAEAAGFDAKTLYRARDLLKVEEMEMEGKKWWSLTQNCDPF